MKKLAIFTALVALMCTLCSCGSNANIDELISARELPEYSEKKSDSSVNIKVDDGETNNSDAIVID